MNLRLIQLLSSSGHVHFFGTAATPFTLPLCNALRRAAALDIQVVAL